MVYVTATKVGMEANYFYRVLLPFIFREFARRGGGSRQLYRALDLTRQRSEQQFATACSPLYARFNQYICIRENGV